jgi:uncharacterized protein YukE
MSMINIDPNSLQTMANRIDQWAQDLKAEVVSRAREQVAWVEDAPGFEGEAARAYKARFTEMAAAIQRAIESISDEQLLGMRHALEQIGLKFQDLDRSLRL